jgi:hypothetical protein
MSCAREKGVSPQKQVHVFSWGYSDGSFVLGPVHDRSDSAEKVSRKWYYVGCVVESPNEGFDVIVGYLPLFDDLCDVSCPSHVFVVGKGDSEVSSVENPTQ